MPKQIWIYGQVDNINLKFKAIEEGQATIKTNLDVSDASATAMGGVTSATITIKGIEEPEPPPTDPEPPATNNITNNTTNNLPVEPNFKKVNETVYAIKRVNIRESYSTSSKSLGKLEKGNSVTRTGIGDNGWDRVVYEGKTCYIFSSYLTTEKPDEEPENKIENNETDSNKVDNNTIDNNVVSNETNEIKNNVTNEMNEYEKIVNEIGELPQVGTTYAEYFLMGCIAISIIGLIITNYKISKKE